MSYARATVSLDRQHEIRNEIALLLCEMFDLPEMKGTASSIANKAIEKMSNHAWKKWLINEVETCAKIAREHGDGVEITRIPTVAVNIGDDEYFFQDESASKLLDECPDFLNVEDWLLWTAQGW